MRRLERQAAQGDARARDQLVAARLRTGDLDRERVKLAAHLSDPLAEQLTSEAPPSLKCSCGGSRACMRCGGTGRRPLPTDLVPFARSAEVPGDVLREWACDCAAHVLPLVTEDEREPLRNLIASARALDGALASGGRSTQLRGNVLRREPAPADQRVSEAVQLLVNAAVFQRNLQPPHRWRTAYAGVVTCAYRAAGNGRDERDWQRRALSGRLLA